MSSSDKFELTLVLSLIAAIILAGAFACGGNPGPAGDSCSVDQTDSGAIISCPDGSSVEILNGEDGDDGKQVIIICKKHGRCFVRS